MTAFPAVSIRRGLFTALLIGAVLPASAQDQTVSGNLTVTGDADIGGNTFSFGTRSDSATTPGLNILYGDGTPATLYFNATRNGAHWLWQQNSTSPQMKLTSTNQLLLYSTTNSTTPAVTLDPAGTSTFSGPVQFQGTVTMSGSSVTNLNASNITAGILPIANGGTGTSTPGLIAGSDVTITGTWPNQTISLGGNGVLPSFTGLTGYALVSDGTSAAWANSLGIGLTSSVVWGGLGAGREWLIGGIDSQGGVGSVFGTYDGSIIIQTAGPDGTIQNWGEALFYEGAIIEGNAGIDSLNLINGASLRFDDEVVLSRTADATTLAAGGVNQHLILKPSGTGNVGIGTTTPSKKLTLLGSGYSARVLLDTPDTASYPGFEFRHAGNDAYRAVVRSNYVSGGGADLQFFTSGNLGAPVMLMDKSGNVGVGTSTPTTKLDVAGNAKVSGTLTVGGSSVLTQTALAASNTWTAAQNFQSGVNVTSGALNVTSGAVRSGSGQNLYLQPNAGSVTAMTLATSGYVGIGTTGPAYPLDVAGYNDVARFSSLNNWAGLSLTKSNGQTWTLVSGNNGNSDDFSIEDRSAGRSGAKAPFVIRHSNANVGVGTSTPRSALEVQRASSGTLGPVITLTNSSGGANASAAIDFNTYNVVNAAPGARLQAVDDGDFSAHLVIATKQSGANANPLVERLRLTSTGRLLVGTPTDDGSTRLQVDGNVKTSGTLTAAAISAPTVTMTSATLTTATVNTMSVKTVLRVAPAGDLSMGEFTSGTNPAN